MPFTQNFNYCMEQKKYTAYKFAKIIGASNQGVLNWQSGECIPYPKTRQKIADHFGITLAELDGDDLPVLPEKGAKKAPPIRRPRARRGTMMKILRKLWRF